MVLSDQKKLMTYSWEKCRTDGQTDGLTDNGDFTGPSVGRGSKNWSKTNVVRIDGKQGPL